MKIFSPHQSLQPSSESAERKIARKGKKSTLSPKPEVSAKEIRSKLASHVDTSNAAKSQLRLKNSQQLGAGFLSEKPADASLEEKKDHILNPDVTLNDPKSPETQEKLKSVLAKGAFNFNPKEREALEKILADR